MDDAGLTSIIIVAALIALHFLLVFMNAALSHARRNDLRERMSEGDTTAGRILRVTEKTGRLHISIEILLMLVRFAIAGVAAIGIGRAVLEAEQNSPLWDNAPIAYLGIMLPLALLVTFLGEIVAAGFGRAYADQTAGALALPARVIVGVLRPLAALFEAADVTISRLGGEEVNKAVTEQEILSLVEEGQEGGVIEDEEKEMIYSVLQFGETLAREVMVPRPDIKAITLQISIQDALKEFIDTGHSRIPVYDASIDDIKGILYAKDLLAVWHNGATHHTTVKGLLREPYFVPETKGADMLFKELQARKTHIAIIVDEYGGTAGLVTIEDLIEEILGDIRDEYDGHEEDEYIALSEGDYIVDGAMNLDDINALLEIDLPTDDNDSLGGYVYSLLGRVPEVGEKIEDDEHGVHMDIEAVDNRRIRKIHIRRVEKMLPSEIAEAEKEEASSTKVHKVEAEVEKSSANGDARADAEPQMA